MRPIFELLKSSENAETLSPIAQKLNEGLSVINHYGDLAMHEKLQAYQGIREKMRALSTQWKMAKNSGESQEALWETFTDFYRQTFSPEHTTVMMQYNDMMGRQQMADLVDENKQASRLRDLLGKRFPGNTEKKAALDALIEIHASYVPFLHLKADQLAIVADMIDIVHAQISADVAQEKNLAQKMKEQLNEALIKLESARAQIVLLMKEHLSRRYDLVQSISEQLYDIFEFEKNPARPCFFLPSEAQCDKTLAQPLSVNPLKDTVPSTHAQKATPEDFFADYLLQHDDATRKNEQYLSDINYSTLKNAKEFIMAQKSPTLSDRINSATAYLQSLMETNPYVGLVTDVTGLAFNAGKTVMGAALTIADSLRGNFISARLFHLASAMTENKNVQGIAQDMQGKAKKLYQGYQSLRVIAENAPIEIQRGYQNISAKIFQLFSQPAADGNPLNDDIAAIDRILAEIDTLVVPEQRTKLLAGLSVLTTVETQGNYTQEALYSMLGADFLENVGVDALKDFNNRLLQVTQESKKDARYTEEQAHAEIKSLVQSVQDQHDTWVRTNQFIDESLKKLQEFIDMQQKAKGIHAYRSTSFLDFFKNFYGRKIDSRKEMVEIIKDVVVMAREQSEKEMLTEKKITALQTFFENSIKGAIEDIRKENNWFESAFQKKLERVLQTAPWKSIVAPDDSISTRPNRP